MRASARAARRPRRARPSRRPLRGRRAPRPSAPRARCCGPEGACGTRCGAAAARLPPVPTPRAPRAGRQPGSLCPVCDSPPLAGMYTNGTGELAL